MENIIYLDNNSTTLIDPDVLKTMSPYLNEIYGNPNAMHAIAKETHQGLATASDQIYFSLNMDVNDTLIMTSCATESINSVHHSVFIDFLKDPSSKKNKIITSPLEHSSVVKSLEPLKQWGIEIVELPIVDQSFTVEDFIKVYNPQEVLLVSLALVNSETGIIHPTKKIADICKKDNVLIHCDATQAIGKIPMDLSSFNVDYLSFSGHKFHAPKGAGGLILSKNAPFNPLLHGGEQMGGFRSGTINVSSIIGLGEALYKATKNLSKTTTQILTLRNILEDFLKTIPQCTILGENKERIPNTTYFTIDNIDLEYFAWYLNQKVAITTGSACSSIQPSSPCSTSASKKARGIRVSLSKFTTEEEIKIFINHINKFFKKDTNNENR